MSTSEGVVEHTDGVLKKPYEEPTLEQREDLLQITESMPPVVPLISG